MTKETKTINATSRIGLPAGSKDVRLDRVDRVDHVNRDTCHHWRLWLSYDRNMEFGTYLMLHDNGAITRITVHPDGWEQTMSIKPPSRGHNH